MKRSSLAVVFLSLVAGITSLPAFADSTLYSNGPMSSSPDDGISFYLGVAVSDSFTLTQNSTLTGADFIVSSFPIAPMVSVDWSISNTPFGGTPATAGTINQFLFLEANGGLDAYYESISIPSLSLAAGTYYFTLQNAMTTFGVFPVYWDINNGPSIAYQEFIQTDLDPGAPPSNGPYPTSSQTFDIVGNANGDSLATPEPSSFLLLGSGLAGMAGMIRRKFRV